MRHIMIIGATSAIASACARLWVDAQADFILAARDSDKLENTSADLLARGAASVRSYQLDCNDNAALEKILLQIPDRLDLLLVAHGSLPDQAACQRDVTAAIQEFHNNASSTIAVLTVLANRLEQQRSGQIVVISSVAGDRGRPSNYLYGSAKAAVDTFCEGLRARLFKSGVHLLLIKPGFVDTPMTRDLQLPSLLTASSEQVARSIDRAIKTRRNIIYAPFYWRYIMWVIGCIPTFFFKRLKL